MFYGQERLRTELDILLPILKNDENENPSLLFRAPSGYGKTTLSFIVANYIDKFNYHYYIPDSSGIVNVKLNKRIHIVDEIHTCKNQENFYPLIDSNKYIFIFTTNETGELKEPLQNRCLNYIFEPYSDIELAQIIDNIMMEDRPLNFNYYLYLTNYSRTPRVIVKLCQRLKYLFTYYGVPKQENDFRFIFENILNIREGLDEEQMRYMTFLNERKFASLDLISNAIGIDKATIKRDIEPGLIYKNLININSKGRSIINE